MTTSGTIGATSIDVSTVIDHAFRRCGKLASTVSGELLLSARENLYFLLSDLANRGLSLWCVQKTPLACVPGKELYPLPNGTVDLLKVMHRTTTVILGTFLSAFNYQGSDLSYARKVSEVSLVLAADATKQSFAVEYSADGLTWTTFTTWVLTAKAGSLNYLDLDGAPAAQFWRVRNPAGTLPNVTALAWHELPVELIVTVMNRDDYVNLPNRHQKAARPVQYWFDKQITPQLFVWPLPQDELGQLVVWVQRHIQDPGALSGTLDIPQRWLESIIYTLATRVALEIPAGELPPGRLEFLEAKAAEHLSRAEDGENDGAPYRIQPNIRGYTR